MKWLFAAAAAVCLFACGGPQDQMDKAEVHDTKELCDGLSGSCPNGTDKLFKGGREWCSPGGASPMLVKFVNVTDPNTGTVSTTGVITQINSQCLGGRFPGCGCVTQGDALFKDITPGAGGGYNAMGIKYNWTTCSPTPDYMPTGLFWYEGAGWWQIKSGEPNLAYFDTSGIGKYGWNPGNCPVYSP